jgi:hypothetical protein
VKRAIFPFFIVNYSLLIAFREKYMSDSDGIQISDKPSWQHTVKELAAILVKRAIALPSKMLGFKPFCLYLATWLLVRGYIKDWIWFAVLVMVLFGIVGLKVISRMKSEE